MKNALSVPALLILLFCCVAGEARAQEVKVDIKEIEVALLPTPQFDYSGESKKLPSPKNWIEIEVEFEVDTRAKSGFVDELEFTYYVMMADKKTMYVERVTHVNMLAKEKTFSNMFISPTTLMKLTGREVTSDSAVAGVAIEVRSQGALIGGDATESASTKWWMGKQQTAGGLLKKSDTPFAPLWWDRYAEISKGR